jgi:hypothetical protein
LEAPVVGAARPSRPGLVAGAAVVSTVKNIGPFVKACNSSLSPQAKKTCDYQYHDHHTDDVKDVHCVLLQVRDAICSRDGRTSLVVSLAVSWVSKRRWSNHALIDQRKSVQKCSLQAFVELCLSYQKSSLPDQAVIESAPSPNRISYLGGFRAVRR